MFFLILLLLALGLAIYTTYLCLIASRRRAADRVLALVSDTVSQNLPLLQVLVYARDEASLWERPMLKRLTSDLADGIPLDEALARCDSLMPPLAVSQVRQGIQCGRLSESLRAAVRAQDNRAARRTAWFAPMLYLSLLVLTATSLAALQGNLIYPKYREILDDFGGQWPPFLDLTAGTLDFLAGLATFGGLLMLFVALPLMARGCGLTGRGGLSNLADLIRWALPGWRSSERTMCLAVAARQMALALEAGATDAEAIDQLSSLGLNVIMRRRFRRVADLHRSGQKSLAASFAAVGGFPHHFLWTLATGEAAGNLPLALRLLADDYEARSDRLKQLLFSVVQVLGVVLVAAFTALQPLAWIHVWQGAVQAAMGR
ncbi:MAG TPA: type II secretion system F family protein [Phycisphaerae bacterium]|nr:type II secretion system F family protein [Phycisphaerae bacterium]